MSDPYQIICVDTETNGLELNDDIIAVSLRVLEQDGSPTDIEFFSYIYAEKFNDPEAYKVNKISLETLAAAPKKEEVIESIRFWWSRHCYGVQVSPMGHNFIGFDKPRLELLLGPLYKKIFHYHCDDSMVVARALQRCGLLPVDSCSLKSLAKFFGISYDDAHHASADTYVCGMVYHRLLKIMNPDIKTRLIRVFNRGYLGIETCQTSR
jgi:DNA polymerase III epsilon subunit-like protein